MNTTPAPHTPSTILPDVYCPPGGYDDKNMGRRFDSKGEKFRYLRAHGMREAEMSHPDKSLGGTQGSTRKRRGSPGNFRAGALPGWMKQELARHVG